MPRMIAPTKEQSRLLPSFAPLPDTAIHLPQTADGFAAARDALLQQTVLGFDTESKPLFHVGQTDNGPHLVQFASLNQAWLLHMQYGAARQLACEILAAGHICKAGFGLDNDRNALQGRLGLELQNVQDLDRVFKRYGYVSSIGVRAAIALVLGQSFQKSKRTSTSNWAARQLNTVQIRYAANDAYAAAAVQNALPHWETLQPSPAPAPRTPGHQPADAAAPHLHRQ